MRRNGRGIGRHGFDREVTHLPIASDHAGGRRARAPMFGELREQRDPRHQQRPSTRVLAMQTGVLRGKDTGLEPDLDRQSVDVRLNLSREKCKGLVRFGLGHRAYQPSLDNRSDNRPISLSCVSY